VRAFRMAILIGPKNTYRAILLGPITCIVSLFFSFVIFHFEYFLISQTF
jgi:hypothetical protein